MFENQGQPENDETFISIDALLCIHNSIYVETKKEKLVQKLLVFGPGGEEKKTHSHSTTITTTGQGRNSTPIACTSHDPCICCCYNFVFEMPFLENDSTVTACINHNPCICY